MYLGYPDKLHVQKTTRLSMSLMKFHSLLTKFWLRRWKKHQKQSNDNWLHSGETHTIFIYSQYKFHDIPHIAYKVMADDGKIIEI